MPKVSYIMPCSRARWITEAVESALRQSMIDIEVMIGDSNHVWEIKDYDPRIRRLDTEGLKLNVAINALIEGASADIICILCDDDVDLHNRAQVIYDGLQDCDIFCASYNRMNEQGTVLGSTLVEPWDYDKYIFGGLNMPLWSGGYRKSKCPPWHPDLRFMGDYGFFLESHKRGLKINTSQEIVANIRHHAGQQSQNNPENMAARDKEKIIIKDIYGIDVRR